MVRRSGRRIAILSDYPAETKMAALGLSADIMRWAGDPEVNVMKPHPRGLEHVLTSAAVSPAEAIFIGDRVERDGEAGKRAGVRTYIRSRKHIEGWSTFQSYRDLVADGVPALV
jgi:putative hydrolase of the HAD superfamily